MRFQIWGLLTRDTAGSPAVSFEKLAEGASLAALLPSFRAALTGGAIGRLYLIDTTANTVQAL